MQLHSVNVGYIRICGLKVFIDDWEELHLIGFATSIYIFNDSIQSLIEVVGIDISVSTI